MEDLNVLDIENEALTAALCGKRLCCRARTDVSVAPGKVSLCIGDWTFEELFGMAGLSAEDRAVFAKDRVNIGSRAALLKLFSPANTGGLTRL